MTLKNLLCGILQATLVCCVAECRVPDKQPAMLSHDAFARAEVFINQTGRPLERTLFAFHFKHGSRDTVIAELAKYQNSDGGFASCLESDTRWCGSSPIGAMKALGILTEIGAPASDPHVRAVIKFLLANFDDKEGIWHALPKEANESPHASWWEVDEKTGECAIESPVFPTAALAGYLQNYARLLPPQFLERITKSSLNYLSTAPASSQMSNIESISVLVRLLPPHQSKNAILKLKKELAAVVVQDPRKWSSYNVKPLTFIHTPQSPFYSEMRVMIDANLDYIISTQKSDGSWDLTWSWEERNPAAWKVAEKEWLGVLTLENLRRLDAFHRIEP